MGNTFPWNTAEGKYINFFPFFYKSPYEIAPDTNLACFDKTRRSLHKQLKKEQSPIFNLNDPTFFTCSSGMGSLSSMYTVGCIKGTEVCCRLSQEASSLPSGERKQRDEEKKKRILSVQWYFWLSHVLWHRLEEVAIWCIKCFLA